jgi:acid phosphatase
MQTSAEYRVLAEVTYRSATEALTAALADKTWTAATEQTADFSDLGPAVILDLDETVLDNSRFQGELALRRSPYSDTLWKEWVASKEAELIPGVQPFLATARSKGFAVFFVTNRTIDEEADTVANLKALGVEATADEVLSNKENGWTSDKTERRKFLAKKHRIALLIGDDLGDFIPSKLTPEKRVEEAAKHSDWWGIRWFLLPNPMYGSWDRALYAHDTTLPDKEILLRKFARVKALHN